MPWRWRLWSEAGRWPSRTGRGRHAQIRQGLDAYRATGAEYQRTFFLSLLAEACGKAGRVEDGLQAWPRRWAMVDHTGNVSTRRKLYRLKGQT